MTTGEILALVQQYGRACSHAGEGKFSAIKDETSIFFRIESALRRRDEQESAIGAGGAERLRSDPWRQAVLNACMVTEACYEANDPEKTVNQLIDWHVMNERHHAQSAQALPTPKAEPTPTLQQLRDLVDAVWNKATQSTQVPSTKIADALIDQVFAGVGAERAMEPVADGRTAFEAIRMFWAQHGSQKALDMNTLAELHSDVECTIRQHTRTSTRAECAGCGATLQAREHHRSGHC